MSSLVNDGAPGSTVFISDLHLAPGEPHLLAALAAFLARIEAEGVASLYVLGDLFDAWPGDDALSDPFPLAVADLLKKAHASGMALYFMAGNRDFLIGEGFSRATGISILTDPSVVFVGGLSLILSHGDLLCTDDAAYQAFRGEVRAKAWQDAFLARPLSERQQIVAGLRAQSESAKAGKTAELMDVNHGAVSELLAHHQHAILVHGHTHRPAQHEITLENVSRQRWVLPDWDLSATPPRGGGILAKDGVLKTIDL